jgi:LuxR family quorum-sensing system transcriptional regulator CciR
MPQDGRSLRLADRFREASEAAASPGTLFLLLAGATTELGFAHFALLHHASLGSGGPSLIRYDNYPSDWAMRFSNDAMFRSDPVQQASQVTNTGFCWDDMSQLVRLSPLQRDIMKESVRFGIGDGFTVPANIPGEPGASCSFVTSPGAPLPRQRLLCAEIIGSYAFKAARRLSGRNGAINRPHLSRREIDCLRLVASGKTDWEAAAILGLNVETVRSYVKRARAAYDVVTRTQLVVHALRDAHLSFDDSIPLLHTSL